MRRCTANEVCICLDEDTQRTLVLNEELSFIAADVKIRVDSTDKLTVIDDGKKFECKLRLETPVDAGDCVCEENGKGSCMDPTKHRYYSVESELSSDPATASVRVKIWWVVNGPDQKKQFQKLYIVPKGETEVSYLLNFKGAKVPPYVGV